MLLLNQRLFWCNPLHLRNVFSNIYYRISQVGKDLWGLSSLTSGSTQHHPRVCYLLYSTFTYLKSIIMHLFHSINAKPSLFFFLFLFFLFFLSAFICCISLCSCYAPLDFLFHSQQFWQTKGLKEEKGFCRYVWFSKQLCILECTTGNCSFPNTVTAGAQGLCFADSWALTHQWLFLHGWKQLHSAAPL